MRALLVIRFVYSTDYATLRENKSKIWITIHIKFSQ